MARTSCCMATLYRCSAFVTKFGNVVVMGVLKGWGGTLVASATSSARYLRLCHRFSPILQSPNHTSPQGKAVPKKKQKKVFIDHQASTRVSSNHFHMPFGLQKKHTISFLPLLFSSPSFSFVRLLLFLTHHQPQKLIFIHASLPARIKLLNHGRDVRIRYVVPHLLADPPQVVLRDHALAVDVEQPEGATELLLGVALADQRPRNRLGCGQVEEPVDGRTLLVEGPVGGLLAVADQQVVGLRLGQLEAEGAEDETEFFVGEETVFVGVEEVELELSKGWMLATGFGVWWWCGGSAKWWLRSNIIWDLQKLQG